MTARGRAEVGRGLQLQCHYTVMLLALTERQAEQMYTILFITFIKYQCVHAPFFIPLCEYLIEPIKSVRVQLAVFRF